MSQPQATYLALDVGTRRVGVATSDPSATYAMPLCTVQARPADQACAEIARLAQERQPGAIVYGWPLKMSGQAGRATRRVAEFIEQLEPALIERGVDCELVRWDERLTTTSAEAMLIDADVGRRRRRQVVDQLAAAHILEGYLKSLQAG